MSIALALIDLHSLFTARAAIIPVTGGVMTGFAFAFFRGSFRWALLSDRHDSKSLMNYASAGSLRCICGEKHPEGVVMDRREFCRTCGCEVVAANTTMLDTNFSQKEIKAMTVALKRAAIRASHLELPPMITTVQQLNEYLVGSDPKQVRPSKMHSVQVEQSRVH